VARSPWSGLLHLVRRLRAEDGCPWDRAQTPASLRPYWLEEAYEVLDAIDGRGVLADELGDALFLLVSLAVAAEDAGGPTADSVPRAAAAKMKARHPGLFGRGRRHDGSHRAWEASKRTAGRSALDGVPRALPALIRGHRMGEKATALGYDWPDAAAVRAKVAEELAELDAAVAEGDHDAVADELGDVLFTLCSYGRHLGAPAEDALRGALDRFERRFRHAEDALARDGRADAPPDELDRYWQEAKRA
jgi:ATP diphosphatase